MSTYPCPDSRNVLEGRGALLFSEYVNGLPTGAFLHLGNCPGFEVTPTSENKEHYSSLGPETSRDKNVVIRHGMEAIVTGDEINIPNAALFLGGTSTTIVQTHSHAVSGESIGVCVKGKYYFAAAQSVSDLIVSDLSGAGTINTDFTFDSNGKIFIPLTSTLGAGEPLTIAYKKEAQDIKSVTLGTNPVVEGALWFEGYPVHGPKLRVKIPRVTLAGDGPLPLIADDWSTFKLKISVEKSNAVADVAAPMGTVTEIVLTAETP